MIDEYDLLTERLDIELRGYEDTGKLVVVINGEAHEINEDVFHLIYSLSVKVDELEADLYGRH